MIKQCTVCRETKDVGEFYSRGTLKSGETRYKSECKLCNNKASKARRLNVFDSVLKELNLSLQCELCGYSKNRAALCFHHLDEDEKDFGLSGNRFRNRDELKREIEKCVILCHNCHMEVHYPHLDIN